MDGAILAFDLGTHTGWAACNPHGLVLSGHVNLKGGRYEGGGMRYLRFRKVLLELMDTMKPGIVAFEEVRRHMSTDAAHVYGGLLGVLTSTCEEKQVPYIGYPVQHIKQTATGKGVASKALMIAAAKKRWPDQHIETEDQADALWVLETARKNT